MNEASSQAFIAITRADRYPHTVTRDDWESDQAVERLALSHLSVDTDVVELGRVTISIGPDDMEDAFGIEVDMEPSAAAALCEAITNAIRTCSAVHGGRSQI
jgi:hypothetical protein